MRTTALVLLAVSALVLASSGCRCGRAAEPPIPSGPLALDVPALARLYLEGAFRFEDAVRDAMGHDPAELGRIVARGMGDRLQRAEQSLVERDLEAAVADARSAGRYLGHALSGVMDAHAPPGHVHAFAAALAVEMHAHVPALVGTDRKPTGMEWLSAAVTTLAAAPPPDGDTLGALRSIASEVVANRCRLALDPDGAILLDSRDSDPALLSLLDWREEYTFAFDSGVHLGAGCRRR